MPRARLTQGRVKSLTTDKARGEQLLDTDLRGFGVTVYPPVGERPPRRVFFARYGPRDRRRFITIGDFGPLTVDQAREKARNVLAAAQLGQDEALECAQERRGLTFDQWARTYLGRVEGRKKSTRGDRWALGQASRVFGSVALEALRRADVQAAVENVREGVRHRALVEERRLAKHENRAVRPLNPSVGRTTANRWLAAVRACLAEAVRDELLDTNPAATVRGFPENTPRARVLSEEELVRLLEALASEPDPFVRAAFALLIDTGARCSEVRGAKWEDFDLQAAVWRVPSPKAGRPQLVPLPPHLVAMLSEMPRYGQFVISGRDPARPRSDLKRPWARLLEEANLSGVRLHDLRRTYGLRVARQAGLHVASKLLRHADVRVTERVYAPLGFDELREAARSARVVAFPALREPGGSEKR